jgi:hypothetical protein
MAAQVSGAALELAAELSTMLDAVGTQATDVPPDVRAKALAPYIASRARILRRWGYTSDALFAAACERAVEIGHVEATAAVLQPKPDPTPSSAIAALGLLHAAEGRWRAFLSLLDHEAGAFVSDRPAHPPAGAVAHDPTPAAAGHGAATLQLAKVDCASSGQSALAAGATQQQQRLHLHQAALAPAAERASNAGGVPADYAPAAVAATTLHAGDAAPPFDLPALVPAVAAASGGVRGQPSLSCSAAGRLSMPSDLAGGPALLVFLRHFG